MQIQEGYVYHINDEYFEKVQDDKLMQNKENGTYRPTFFCIRDEKTSLLWMVPMSTRVEKFQAIHDKQVARYGKCLTIVIGEYDNRKAVFLLQNMFPILPKYLDHIHTRNGNPVPVKHSIQLEVKRKLKQVRRLTARGIKIVFPDILRLEKLMLEELKEQQLAKALDCTMEYIMSLDETEAGYDKRTGLPKSKKYLECDLPPYLQSSLENMIASWKLVDGGKQDLHWDIYWCELNADINSAEVGHEISTEQAWYLREKYLRMKRGD